MTLDDDRPDPDNDVLDAPTPADIAALDEPLMRPLAGFTNEQILTELEMRFTVFVFRGEEPCADDAQKFTRWAKGPMTARIGMAQRIMWDLERDLYDA